MLLTLFLSFLMTAQSVFGAGLYTGPRQPRGNCEMAECDYPAHSTKAHFSYERGTCDAPPYWYTLAECWYQCNNHTHTRQSPVNIRSSDTRYRPYPFFQFHSKLCERVDAVTKNNGHAPHFEVEDDDEDDDILLTNVPERPQDDVYVFKEMHTHVGKTNGKGSEHSVNGRFYPLETHMVFWNNKYSDVVEAKRSEDGLAVIGVFVKVADDDDDEDDEEEHEIKDHSPGRRSRKTKCSCDDDDDDCKGSRSCDCDCDDDCDGDNICRSDDDDDDVKYCSAPRKCDVRYARRLSFLMEKYYPKVREYSTDADEVEIEEGISPRDAIPYDWHFYTYKGSLTTPPCFQTVQWMVMRCPIKVSKKAYKMLSIVEDSDHHPLKKYGVDRPTQRGLDGQHRVKPKRNFRWTETSRRCDCYEYDD